MPLKPVGIPGKRKAVDLDERDVKKPDIAV
jgi:hypothetical protein